MPARGGLRFLKGFPTCDPFKALATESSVEIIDLKLSSLTENSFEIAQRMAVFLGLKLQTLGKSAKTF